MLIEVNYYIIHNFRAVAKFEALIYKNVRLKTLFSFICQVHLLLVTLFTSHCRRRVESQINAVP